LKSCYANSDTCDLSKSPNGVSECKACKINAADFYQIYGKVDSAVTGQSACGECKSYYIYSLVESWYFINPAYYTADQFITDVTNQLNVFLYTSNYIGNDCCLKIEGNGKNGSEKLILWMKPVDSGYRAQWSTTPGADTCWKPKYLNAKVNSQRSWRTGYLCDDITGYCLTNQFQAVSMASIDANPTLADQRTQLGGPLNIGCELSSSGYDPLFSSN
jgi:hypothetical protein